MIDNYKIKNKGINKKYNDFNINGNNNLDYEKLMIELNNKEKIIKSLNIKLKNCLNEYNKSVEINYLYQNNSMDLKQKFKLLINDKNELKKENQNLKNYIEGYNKQLKKADIILKERFFQNNKEKNNLNNKLKEYKIKVITLKKKVNELYEIINKLRNSKYQTSPINNNYNNNNMDFFPVSSSPSQAQKIPVVNNKENKFHNKQILNKNIMMKSNSQSNFGKNEYLDFKHRNDF